MRFDLGSNSENPLRLICFSVQNHMELKVRDSDLPLLFPLQNDIAVLSESGQGTADPGLRVALRWEV